MRIPLTVIVLLASSAHCFATSLTVTAGLYAVSATSDNQATRLAGTLITSELVHRFNSEINALFSAGLQLESASSQSLYAQDFGPRQGPLLTEASLNWNGSGALSISAGALDQNRWDTPLLLWDQTFPALVESYRVRIGRVLLVASAEQAYAADTAAPLLTGKKLRSPSSFFLEKVSAAYGDPETTLLEGHAAHFLFENLSSALAQQSRFSGNSVTGTGNHTTFAFSFRGFETGIQVRQRVARQCILGSHLSWLKNLSAAAGKNTGFYWSLMAATKLSRDFEIIPSVHWFKIESDTAPAFYNDRTIGHTNTKGAGLALNAAWRGSGLDAGVRWTRTEVMSPNPYQASLDYFELQLRTSHEVF